MTLHLITAQKQYIDLAWDNLFKSIVSGGWCNSSGGDVESPYGAFAIIEVEEADLRDSPGTLFDTFRDEWPLLERSGMLNPTLASLPVGWYVTVEDSAGFIFVYHFETKQAAEVEMYARTEQYNDWSADEDERG